jgi:uncharacterized protein (TIGR00255 family)
MPLKSMTGFARSQGAAGSVSWQWEVRSVNGKSLDIRLRLPPGSEALDGPARELCGKKLNRGSVSLTLAINRQATGTVIRLNEAALAQVGQAARRASTIYPDAAPATIDGMLALRGVLEVVEAEEGEGEQALRNTAILATLSASLDAMVADRMREGGRLGNTFANQIDEIERLTLAAEQSPQRTPQRIEQRLQDQVAKLMTTGGPFEAERLHQEAMLLAVKADIEEEVQRLKSHIAEARSLIGSAEPVGRKLDFLTQEFFREANTLCSKAIDIEITRHGLALKAVIDQMREQVQNIE